MEKFIPLGKMSKKKQLEFHRLSRKDWGGISPVTRKEKNPKAYNRASEKRKGAAQKRDSLIFILQTKLSFLCPSCNVHFQS